MAEHERFEQPYGNLHEPNPPHSSSSSTLAGETQPDIIEDEEKSATHEQSEPPNGGLQAWLQVLGSFFLFFNSWGLINTFGVYQTFYSSNILSNESNSNISWIGSLRAFILLGSPLIWGPIFDRGYPRVIVAIGSFLVVFGIMMTSLCSSLYQLILAQGVCVGLGSGALFLTGVAIVPTYFTTKKSLAVGVAAAGSSIGGVVYPIVFYKLQPQIGFGWTVRIIGFLALFVSVVPASTIRRRIKPEQRRAIFDKNLFREPSFNVWSLAWLFGNMGLYIPFFFIQQYATDVAKLPFNSGFWTLTAINATSVVGRILPGLMADRLNNPVLVIGVCTFCSTVLAYCWIAIRHTIAGLFVFCCLYGFFSGAFVSLSTPATVSLAPSLDGIGTRLGIFNFIGSLGLLVGNPVAGAIINRSWTGMQAFCGTACALALLLIVLTKASSQRDQNGREKTKKRTMERTCFGRLKAEKSRRQNLLVGTPAI